MGSSELESEETEADRLTERSAIGSNKTVGKRSRTERAGRREKGLIGTRRRTTLRISPRWTHNEFVACGLRGSHPF